MKTLFIEARKKINVNNLNLELLNALPDRIGLLTTVQYVHLLSFISNYLEKKGKKVFLAKGKLARYKGQILGCDVSAAEKIIKKVNAFLVIGSGSFHYSPVLMLERPLFLFSPESNRLEKIDKKDIEELKIKRKSALMKFYNAEKVGIIVSTKPGQYNMKSAIELKKNIEKNNKKAFIFICDKIDLKELENFDCDIFVNTACPALFMEPEILNMQDIR